MKKHIYLLALFLSACTTSEDQQRQERQFAADVEANGPEVQTAYFACGYADRLWECRQKIWDAHPKPHMPSYEVRNFVLRYLDAEERKGTQNVLKAERQPCGEVKGLNYAMWRDGRYAECSDGREYQILKDGEHWRITQTKGGAK